MAEGGRLVPAVSAEAVNESEPRVFLEEEHVYSLCVGDAVVGGEKHWFFHFLGSP